MRDYMEFDCTPIEEDCVQVSSDSEYMPSMREESKRMVQIARVLWPTLDWKIKSNPYDAGNYLSINAYYDTEDETQVDKAYDAESNWPLTWQEADERVQAIIETVADKVIGDL